ncbi:MAG: hypothetical protein ACK46X_08525, partial [Candidatus Sericytochromatia bacterium]
MSLRAFRPLLPFLRPHWLPLAGAAACVLASAGATMALVPLAKHAGEVFGNLTLGALNGVVLGLVGLYALKGVFGFAQSALSHRVALEVTARLREAAEQRRSTWLQSLIGTRQRIVIEKPGDRGHAENFAEVLLPQSDIGSVQQVKITNVQDGKLIGAPQGAGPAGASDCSAGS